MFADDAAELCRRMRRACTQHANWERVRRAGIDVRRVRLLMKLEELVFEECEIGNSLTNRAGVAALLLHQPTVHEEPATAVN